MLQVHVRRVLMPFCVALLSCLQGCGLFVDRLDLRGVSWQVERRLHGGVVSAVIPASSAVVDSLPFLRSPGSSGWMIGGGCERGPSSESCTVRFHFRHDRDSARGFEWLLDAPECELAFRKTSMVVTWDTAVAVVDLDAMKRAVRLVMQREAAVDEWGESGP